MQTSTVMKLSLCLLYLCISHSQSLSSFETCNCESWDEVCWDDCLSGQFAESKSFPCAQIRSCQKHRENPICKDVPTTIPSRCGDRRSEFPCGFIKVCQNHQQHPDCKDVPTTIPVQCRTTTPSPTTTPRTITQQKRQCKTTSESGSSKKNVPCQFPFTFNSITYDACTNEQDPDGRFWCSTKVDRSRQHTGDNWGYCSDECFPSTQIQSDKRFLILGGYTRPGSELETEVIDVSSSSSSSPFGDIPSERRGAVGGLLGSAPIYCGGWSPYGDSVDSCISFKNSQWTKTHEMTTKRDEAESVQLNSTTMWILGGQNGVIDKFDSTEFLTADSSVGIPGPMLPIAMNSFCTVKYSDHQIYIIGGEGTEILNKVFIYNPMDSFSHIEGPALKNKRSSHACAVMSNGQQSQIVVAGGFIYGPRTDGLSSVEIFDPTVNNWIPGPSLPYKLHESAMATSPDGGGVILFGGTNADKFYANEDKILELRFGANEWTIHPQKLNQPRKKHVVIPIP